MSTPSPGPGSLEPSPRRLRRRFVTGFAVAAALVLVITGSSILELRRAQRLERDESQHDQLMQALGSLQASFVRKSAAFRGFLLFGRPTFLEEAGAARREFLDRLVWLRRVTSDAKSDELIRRLLASEAAHQKAWDLRLTSTTAESPPIDAEYFLQTISPRGTEVIRDIRALTAHQTRMLEAVHRSAEKRLFRTALTVLAGGGGALLLTIVLTGFLARRLTDLYEKEQAARRQAEAAEGRSAFLAEASALLAASIDWETTLEQVSRLAVPRIADWCVVDILEDGVLTPFSVSHVAQSKIELVHEIWRRFPRDQHAQAGPAHVARTGRPELIEQVSDELLGRVSRNEEHLEMVRRLRLGSSVCVPLEARGQVLGALTFACEIGGRRYGPDDVAFAESLANRASLAIDNARLFRQAHEAIRLRDEFLSIASHELKTPVTTLRLQIESLMRHLPPEAKDATGPRLSTTRRQVDRLQKLIERLLDISRLTGGRLELDLEPVNLGVVVSEVVGRFDEELRRAGCHVTVRGADPLSGRWDRSRLDQVVTNLLSNAIKYGSGQPIEITLDGDERTARLEVRDHGIGIPDDKLPRIFERFERAVSERHYGGLGLGLWIVRQIVDAFGGSVRALSAPGSGSTFVVELPRVPPGPDTR